jgi:hypothetical protein
MLQNTRWKIMTTDAGVPIAPHRFYGTATMSDGTVAPDGTVVKRRDCATVFSMFAAWLAYKMDAVEVMTAIVGGIFGLLGGVSLRIIEGEGEE